MHIVLDEIIDRWVGTSAVPVKDSHYETKIYLRDGRGPHVVVKCDCNGIEYQQIGLQWNILGTCNKRSFAEYTICDKVKNIFIYLVGDPYDEEAS